MLKALNTVKTGYFEEMRRCKLVESEKATMLTVILRGAKRRKRGIVVPAHAWKASTCGVETTAAAIEGIPYIDGVSLDEG